MIHFDLEAGGKVLYHVESIVVGPWDVAINGLRHHRPQRLDRPWREHLFTRLRICRCSGGSLTMIILAASVGSRLHRRKVEAVRRRLRFVVLEFRCDVLVP